MGRTANVQQESERRIKSVELIHGIRTIGAFGTVKRYSSEQYNITVDYETRTIRVSNYVVPFENVQYIEVM